MADLLMATFIYVCIVEISNAHQFKPFEGNFVMVLLSKYCNSVYCVLLRRHCLALSFELRVKLLMFVSEQG